MKKLLILLLILILIGILWVGSNFWTFSKDEFVSDSFNEKSKSSSLEIDLEFVKKEFEPANEF